MEVTGYATCHDAACEMGGVQREVVMVETRTRTSAAEMKSLTINETIYHHLADDQDMYCPACGQPCSLSTEKPRVIPVQVGA